MPSRDIQGFALGIVQDSKFQAALTNQDIGSSETRFNVVTGLNGDKRSTSFESILMKDYYIMVGENTRQNLFFERCLDTDSFNNEAAFLLVSAIGGCEMVSFESAAFLDHYLCFVNVFGRKNSYGFIRVKSKTWAMRHASKCSWDSRVLDKNGKYSNTAFEGMKHSMRGPEVLGEEMGMPLGAELFARTKQVIASRTLEWTQGIPEYASCTQTGDRCSMGLACKNFICQVIGQTIDLSVDVVPSGLGN